MMRDELPELGYIAPIATVPSILEHGILSYRRATRIAHVSIANQEVQGLRAKKLVPQGRALHAYANLYICPRNPMLLVKSDIHEQICVLRVSREVLDIQNAIITDSNAATRLVRFRPAPEGLRIVDRDRTFAEWWTHPNDPIEQSRHKHQKCAEVLIPDVVPADYIIGAYVSCDSSRDSLHRLAPNLPITVDPHLFFQRGAT